MSPDMSPDVQPPLLERYGDTWVQHPDGLSYGPPYGTDDDTLRCLEAEGTLGHSAVRRRDERYFLRHPDADADRSDRFSWTEDNEVALQDLEEEDG